MSLFIQHVQAIKPDFQVTDNNALAIAHICARLKLFSPQALLIHFGEATGRSTLPLLSGGPRDAPIRQQTLTDTVP